MYDIVIVDDEREIREGIATYVGWDKLGFRVAASFSGAEQAYEYLQKNSCEVLLCDIRMPKMSGLELTKKIFEEKIDTLVVLLSAYRDFEYAKDAISYGVTEYIVKSSWSAEYTDVFSRIKLMLDARENAPKRQPLNYNERMIMMIKEYVNKNYMTVTLQSAARHMSMNASYLSRYFKQHANVNFSDYVNRIKMEHAAEMLLSPSTYVSDIAGYLGYSSLRNFSDAFKRCYSVTPWQYRTQQSRHEEEK